eukprot:GAHX01005392.1.p2 GENE.GAHX01005392.1~~GAHX01005392.1.p2  ORF type:complete len:69 (-),score=7.26 GAHX01005392.1:225-431(-)
MDIQGPVNVAVTLVGKERHVKQNAIQIVDKIFATKIREFAQLDANLIGLETNVIYSVHRCVNRLVIDL